MKHTILHSINTLIEEAIQREIWAIVNKSINWTAGDYIEQSMRSIVWYSTWSVQRSLMTHLK